MPTRHHDHHNDNHDDLDHDDNGAANDDDVDNARVIIDLDHIAGIHVAYDDDDLARVEHNLRADELRADFIDALAHDYIGGPALDAARALIAHLDDT